ncbi:hypothetical protein Goklo_008744 [Gossypium klotzschianum]|uniref:RNase H type-1 domain-containing protein n=2 Tax=Gossypium klotzschianum TaxID=34286 RepID=A0A7J8V0V2_9ROSI|nr:hypothetical protein [Gossypium klotzschianum]
MRALLWIRSVYDELMLQENFWWICLNRCRVDSIKSKPVALIWRPPPRGCLKFNVCGIANEDRASCGGVLRDKEGVARALFLGSIAAIDTDLAEIGAAMVALDVFFDTKWKLNDYLFIALGSLVVFYWCANKSMRLWSLQATFADIERDIENVTSLNPISSPEQGYEALPNISDKLRLDLQINNIHIII